jgi:virginiamycin A acetyltransferase
VIRFLERLVIRTLFRNEFESRLLRLYFRKRYFIHVGDYSFGCFDASRIPVGTTIGRYCSIAHSARVVDANHPHDRLTTHPVLYSRRLAGRDLVALSPTRLVIEDDVWIGHGATVLPGCARIGRGAVVGAGAVVTHDVPAYAVVAGSPARVIRSRFAPDVIDALEASKWWTLDMRTLSDRLARHRDVLTRPTADALRRFSADTCT